MSLASLPENTEALLLYLLTTVERSGRTLDTIRRLKNVEEALSWLMENGYVHEYWGSLDLTLAGMHAARQLQSSSEEAPRTTRETAPMLSDGAVTTMLDTHPLRPRRDRSRLALEKQTLQFLLAFDKPQNALPIPVLDGDILGRSEADINLPEDDYISGQHCSFSVKTVAGQSTLFIEDLGSRNGTFVNKAQIKKGQLTPLDHGSRIQVGSTTLIVVAIPR